MTATVTVLHPDRGPAGEGIGDAELMATSGLSYRQVDFFSLAGHLHPSGGRGQARRFSQAETRVATLLKQLLDVGFTLTAAAALAREHVEVGRVVRVQACGSVLIGARAEA